MISDLSPGDRLSLKGKLFELQKKLTIMDLEKRLDNQYSYQPQIKSYDLPNRPRDFIQNNAKAEIIRQQKKKLLQDSIAAQTEESCTFAPKIYTSSEKFAHLDSRPVHIRLSEKAKEYRDSKERRKAQFTYFDDNGRKLFSPEINRSRNAASLNSSISMSSAQSSVVPPVNTVTADEFLYQDAKDREIRHANLIQQYKSEAQQAANVTKMNATSHKLLKRRTEKSVSAVFTVIDTNADDAFDYNDFTEFLSRTKLWDGKDQDEVLSDQQILWNCFDHYNMGTVLRRDFQTLGYCFLMHKSPKGALESFSRHEKRQREENEDHESHSLHQESRFPTMREKELQRFRTLLSMLADYAMRELQQSQSATVPEAQNNNQRKVPQHPGNSSHSIDGNHSVQTSRRSVMTTESMEPSFKPKIYSHSYKLAQRKERREQEFVNQVVQQQQAKLLESQQQQLLQEEEQAEDLRGRQKWMSRRPSKRSTSQQQSLTATAGGSVSSSVERNPLPAGSAANDSTLNKMNISELEADIDDNDSVTALRNNFGSDSVPQLDKSGNTRPLAESGQSLSTNASRLADKLIARGVLMQQKKEKLAEQVKEQEDAMCTFRPKIKILRTKPKPPTAATDASQTQQEASTIMHEDDQIAQQQDRERRRQQRREERRQRALAVAETNNLQPAAAAAGEPTRRGSIASAMQDILPSSATNNKEDVEKLSENDDDDDSSTSSSPPPPPPPPPSSNVPPDAPVYERLYALKDKKPVPPTMYIDPKEQQEMEGCTFQPHIERRMVNLNHQSTQDISAYNKTVARMREINAAKQKKKEDEENAWKEVDERYKRNRELLVKQGPNPFNFQSEKRLKEIAEKARAKAQDKTDLIVEVKLSAAKTSRIVVAHNEDPQTAVQKFAKIYGLEGDAVQLLLTVVQQAMQARADAITRAQAEAEEAERRLREEQERLAAEAEAAAAAEEAARQAEELERQQQLQAQFGHGKKRRGKTRHRVINDHGEEEFFDVDDEEGEHDEDDMDYDSMAHAGDGDMMEPMMILTGYDNYGNPIYAPAEQFHHHHHHHHSRGRAHSRDHNNHHHSFPHDGYVNQHGMMMQRTLSDELGMIHVDDEYSSYTGTSSDLSDDIDDMDEEEDEEDDEDYDSEEEDDEDEDENGVEGEASDSAENAERKKQKRKKRRGSSKRPSILSQFF